MDELPENVVQLDVLRFNSQHRKPCHCRNRKFLVDAANHEVTCEECGSVVDPFEAIKELAHNHEDLNRQHQRMLEERKTLAQYKPWLLEVRKVEENYRRHMLPVCPSCERAFHLRDIKIWRGE